MSIVLFVIIISIVVLGHEWGHFMAARLTGCDVEEFGFGFPPKLIKFKKKNWRTEYSINWIPFGGFVRVKGEDGTGKDDPRSFASRGYLAKMFILVAGVLMNVIIAIIAFTIVGMAGSRVEISDEEFLSKSIEDPRITISFVGVGSPADEAGLIFGDNIVAVNGQAVQSTAQIQSIINENKGKEVLFQVQRGDTTKEFTVLARAEHTDNEGPTGIALISTGIQRLNLWEAFVASFARIYLIFAMTLGFLVMMVQSLFGMVELPPEASFTGPVGLVGVISDFRQLGWVYMVNLIGLISTSLAFFNIIPIPALDGGRMFFVTLEKIRRKPLNEKLEGQIYNVSFSILLALMVFVTIKDVMDLF
jgi:regulator of sigma E protease